MTALGDGLGRVFNVIHSASTVEVPLTRATSVSFVSFLADGSQTLTFTQADSKNVLSTIDLNVFEVGGVPANTQSRIHVGPAIGGGWVDATASASADNVADGGDSTNDTYVVTIRAEQLTDGYDSVICTASGGATCVALLHDLTVQRKPSNLASSLVA